MTAAGDRLMTHPGTALIHARHLREPTIAERDAMANGMLPVAADLICQVRDWNATEVQKILTQFGENGLRTLCVVLAAMVPDDQPLDGLVEWTHDPTTRTCARCGDPKPLAQFPKNRSLPSGRHYWCRECHNESRRKAPLRPVADGEHRQAS